MPSLSLSSWFVLAATLAAAVVLTTMITATDEQYLLIGSNYRHETFSSDTNPVLVLDGTGKGSITCSNSDAEGEQENSDVSSSLPSSSSPSAAQITFKALGYPRGTYADIIGGGIASLYSTDIGASTSISVGGANISMEGSSGAGSIYLEGFTLQIGNARVKCQLSTESAVYNVGDVLISGKGGNSVLFSVKDVAEPFEFDGSFKGDVLCTSSSVKLTDVCTVNTGRDSDADGIDDSCDPTPFADLDRDSAGDQIDELDNCPSIYNPDQSDRDRNGIGDACELYPLGTLDPDGDFVGDKPDEIDNCPSVYNPDQRDIDHDSMGDVCDPHAYSAPVYPGKPPVTQSQGKQPQQQPQQQPTFVDRDSDSTPDKADNCLMKPNKDQRDSDHDRTGDVCDNCSNTYNPNQSDIDGDRVGDVCDPLLDFDNDGIGETDNCPSIYNPDQSDRDSDKIGDVCDPTPLPGLR